MSEIKTENPWFNHVINWVEKNKCSNVHAFHDDKCKMDFYDEIEKRIDSHQRIIKNILCLVENSLYTDFVEYINIRYNELETKNDESSQDTDSSSVPSSLITERKKKLNKLKLGTQVSSVYQKKYIKLLENQLKNQEKISVELQKIRNMLLD